VPLLGVVVAAEDDVLVGRVAALEDGAQGGLDVLARLKLLVELLGEVVDRLGDDRVEHRVRER
jgi:hypothetical protein